MKSKVVKIAIAAVAAVSVIFLASSMTDDEVLLAEYQIRPSVCYLPAGTELPSGNVTQGAGVFIRCEVNETGYPVTINGLTWHERRDILRSMRLMHDPMRYESAENGVCNGVPFTDIDGAGGIYPYIKSLNTPPTGSKFNRYWACYPVWEAGLIKE